MVLVYHYRGNLAEKSRYRHTGGNTAVRTRFVGPADTAPP
jgi:hypothetical protein